MRRIRLLIGYDGTNYGGWQKQDNAVSVQETIAKVICRLFGEEVQLQGSGRTDAGVHARGQVAAFNLEHNIPADRLVAALNSNLPDDIRIYEAEEVGPDFHPQFNAKRKTYRYRFYEGRVMPPELRNFCTLVDRPIDWDKAERVLKIFEGEHDFAACAASGFSATSTVRKVYFARLLREEEGRNVFTIEICGNGFLYHMVRIIAGAVKECASGRIDEESLEKGLAEGKREALGPTAPAKGLILWNVEYVE